MPVDPFSGRAEAIAGLDPDKIYVENVRSALGVSTDRAKQICETAVRRGLLERHVEIAFPDGAVAATAPFGSGLPEKIRRWQERDGQMEEIELATIALAKTTFYRLRR